MGTADPFGCPNVMPLLDLKSLKMRSSVRGAVCTTTSWPKASSHITYRPAWSSTVELSLNLTSPYVPGGMTTPFWFVSAVNGFFGLQSTDGLAGLARTGAENAFGPEFRGFTVNAPWVALAKMSHTLHSLLAGNCSR